MTYKMGKAVGKVLKKAATGGYKGAYRMRNSPSSKKKKAKLDKGYGKG